MCKSGNGFLWPIKNTGFQFQTFHRGRRPIQLCPDLFCGLLPDNSLFSYRNDISILSLGFILKRDTFGNLLFVFPVHEILSTSHLIESPTEDVPAKPVKTPMTSAERSRKYRERLKARDNYDQIKKMNAQRGQVYRLQKEQSWTEEEKAKTRADTADRVRKHRALQKAKGEVTVAVNPRVLTRKQREEVKTKNNERKRKEREGWTPQKWRRHRKKCRERYHAKKAKRTVDLVPSTAEETQTDCVNPLWSKRSRQRAVKKVMDVLPRERQKRDDIVKHIFQTFGSVMGEGEEKSKAPLAINELDRMTKRKMAQIALKSAKRKMRNICETFDMSHTYLQRIKKMDNSNVLRRKSLTTLKRHREVHAFYKLPQNATELSEKKKITSKSKGQTTMVLKETLRTLYQGYMQNMENPVSFSLFKSLRPKNVKLSHTEKLNQCLCEMCENVQLKTKTLNPHLPQERRLRSLFDVVRAMLCPSESPFHDLKCLKLECPNCGIQKLKRHLEVEKSSLKNVVNWSRWEANKETKKKMIVLKNGSLEDLIAEFIKDTETFPMHLFNTRNLWT
ncbi:hypothetical protein RRG08_041667 [Elysia crispata]|uniref:Uncharacterized protein n=1 Tax=Elysia crispata TaxID=231223 RepID=A0AAE1CVH5_9GAST|nr:hypothetical protein RRG08_041667 [Elysia crispata]